LRPRIGIGDRTDDPGRLDIDLAHQALGAVIGLADPVRVERVGGEDLGAGGGEALRDLADQLRPGEVQEVVIALLVADEVEPAEIIGGAEPARLDLRPIGAVLDQDPPDGLGSKLRGGVHRFRPRV
jgi:hypothetical protein